MIKDIIKYFLKRDNTWVIALLAICNLTFALIFNNSFAYIITALLIFTIFDVNGYYYLAYRLIFHTESKYIIATYRFIQVIFQEILCLFIFEAVGIIPVLIFLLCWWLGYCDFAYYIVLNDNIQVYEDMFWLRWTPYGIVLTLLNKPINYKWLIAGFIAANITLILYAIYE